MGSGVGLMERAAILRAGAWWLVSWLVLGGFVIFVFVVHPLFHPLPGLTHFLCLAKESKQRKARPMRRKIP
jgi:hypothetical protein